MRLLSVKLPPSWASSATTSGAKLRGRPEAFLHEFTCAVPGAIQNPHRDDPNLGLRFTGQGNLQAIKTTGVAALDTVTWGHAKWISFGHVDVDYWRSQPGFEAAAFSSAVLREEALLLVPIEKFVVALGRPLVRPIAALGANTVRAVEALRVSKYCVGLAGGLRPVLEISTRATQDLVDVAIRSHSLISATAAGAREAFWTSVAGRKLAAGLADLSKSVSARQVRELYVQNLPQKKHVISSKVRSESH